LFLGSSLTGVRHVSTLVSTVAFTLGVAAATWPGDVAF
jgi:hypothetical protein